MTLSEICVRRPVFATMIVTAAVAIGALSFRELGVDQFPDVEIPVATVTTRLPGASPEVVETQVTQLVEDAVSTAESIDELRSTSLEGISIVTVNFLLDRDRDEAIQDVRDKVQTIIARLPDGVDPPIVTRFDVTALPVMTLVVSSDRDLRETTEIAEEEVAEALSGVPGVAQIQVIGGRRRAFQVLVDADALAQHGVTANEVESAIRAQNVELPGGRIGDSTREEGVRVLSQVRSAAELGRIVVRERPGSTPLRLSDLARVEDSEEEPRSLSRLDGQAAVSLTVQKQSGTNTVEVVDAVLARLDEIRRNVSGDVRIEVVRDQSVFVRRSIHEVELHLVLGALLASLAVLLFMGSFRSTIIAAISIPASIVTTFAILRALDYTLNNFTLLALTLSVGVVIDDAIVVLENVHRHVEEGKSPFQAAIDGTKEISLAVMATTLSLVIIFLPTAFMEGRVGRFWQSFGITTAFAIMVSLFVALTLTPMLCSRFLKPHVHDEKKNVMARAVDALNDRLERIYGKLVEWSLRFRWGVVLISIATIASTWPLLVAVGKDFTPQDDTSDFAVVLTMPEGSTLAASEALADEVEGVIRGVRGVERIYTSVGASRGGDDVTEVQMYVAITDLEQRDWPLSQAIAETRRLMRPYADLRPSVQNIGGFGGGARGAQLTFSLRGRDLGELDRVSADLMARMRASEGFLEVDTSAAVRKPEVQVQLDRDRAADLGVRATEVASALRTLTGGAPVSTIRDGDEQYDVWMRLEPEDRTSASRLAALPVRGASGPLRLDAISSFDRARGPAQIDRLDRTRQIEIGANLDEIPLGTAVSRVQELAQGVDMPPGYSLKFGGRARILEETMLNLLGALLLSFLFMYMVLAAQFESFLHPITIMLSLPLSLPFALLSLLMLDDTLNIYSAFGVFMLFGIVKKNGILQVDYTNTLRDRGVPLREAIIEANKKRLRPILMTTLTLIAGMIPIALGEGPGSATRASMAKVIIGGQALSLLITLLIVPVAYSLFEDARRWYAARKQPVVKAVEPEVEAAAED
ncbi:efflux RND transporter permease subunit [Sandaracinus amylolyticus]|uniref:RND multidrug efflux transporter n=1 Tax=Sandaracinus amylolyticus TaxID=927083 RepID=A0A0F6YLQ1_9BACT|nr:efflux RND transporter permease subunit [Sandaracinus amylolyticus]AKF09732.1 RND multidrug efflux transporter [Sandaracinus amylolyticus]